MRRFLAAIGLLLGGLILTAAITNPAQIWFTATSGVRRLLSDKLADVVSVKDYGAKGNNTTDDTAAIQAAWNAAVTGSRKLRFPAGTYLISSPVSISASFLGMSMEGEGINATTIKATAAMPAMLSFTGSTQNFAFSNMTLDGNSLAQTALTGASFAYGKFDKVRAKGTTVAGMSIANGWDNAFRDCEFRDNLGDGIQFPGGNANDVTLYNPLVSGNGGWGLKTSGGGPLRIVGGAFETNAFGSIYSVAVSKPLIVDGVYFEGNAATGFTFSSPVKTVKTDILLNGSGVETTMAHAFDNRNVEIRNCLSTATNTEAFIYAVSAANLTARDNSNPGAAVPLIKTWGDNTFAKPANVTISGNFGFSPEFAVESVANARSLAFSTFRSDSVPLRNYIEKSGYLYPKIFGSAGTVIQRGATKFNGRDTVDVTGTTGDEFGVAIDTSVTTELSGAFIYISAWAKASAATTSGPVVCVGGSCNTASFAADTAYHFIEFANVLPASASTLVGFKKLGATSGDVITYADVVVAVVGAPYLDFQRNLLTPTFTTTAQPSSGTWATGDVVYNSTPINGGPLGWISTAGGAPGTWATLGTIGTSAFASLGTPVNGTFLYCSDCTIANPCAGAGTGAFAKRLNGAWVCN